MLKFYMVCLHGIWTWTKHIMLGLAVLLPGIILLAYMFVTNTPDVGWVPIILAIGAIVLWSPVPLRPVFFKDKTWRNQQSGGLSVRALPPVSGDQAPTTCSRRRYTGCCDLSGPFCYI